MRQLATLFGVTTLLLGIDVLATPPSPPPPRPDMLQMMDKNGDGKISEQEFIDVSIIQIKQGFQRLDSNSDGFVTREESEQAQRKMREFMRQRMQQLQQSREQPNSPQ